MWRALFSASLKEKVIHILNCVVCCIYYQTINYVIDNIITPHYPVTFHTCSCSVVLLKTIFLFSMFHLQGNPDCQNDYLEIREGSSTGSVVGRFCGTSLPSNYTSVTGHILWVKFVSDGSVSGAGFRATFSHCKYSTFNNRILILICCNVLND